MSNYQLNKPLNFEEERWDLFSEDFEQHILDWESEEACTPAANVDPSTTSAFEVKS